MDHTLRGASSARGKHDEERMIKWQLLKLELSKFTRLGEVRQEHTTRMKMYQYSTSSFPVSVYTTGTLKKKSNQL